MEVELVWDWTRDPNGTASFRGGNFFDSARRSLCVGPSDHSGRERRPEVIKIQVLVHCPAQLQECEKEHEEAFLVAGVWVPTAWCYRSEGFPGFLTAAEFLG